jgi:hypothetical protein
VHYPTDINLLLDATRKVIQLTTDLCDAKGLSSWRQSNYNIKSLKKLERAAAASKKSRQKKSPTLQDNDKIKEKHNEYINLAQSYVKKAKTTISKLEELKLTPKEIQQIVVIQNFIMHAERQINQIYRRVILGETIPHEEKVFSIFEPHTEWISKGKAGKPVEFGVRVCIMQDQYSFINHSKVMEKLTDEKVALEMIRETKKYFGKIASTSFDKGFHTKENQKEGAKEVDELVMPVKGKPSAEAKEREAKESFKKARLQHSAVESEINGLEVHGLDYCPDRGIKGLKRYVGCAVVARNLQKIGAIIIETENKKIRWKKQRDYNQIYRTAA